MAVENEISVNKPKKLIGFRHVQMLLLCWGLAQAYGIRVSMSIVIVAMTTIDDHGVPFNWSIIQQAFVLSAFMAGHVVFQVPGRRLAARFGGKVLVVVGVALSGAVAAFIPLGAYDGDWQLVLICRVLQGLAQGAMVPAILNLIDKWLPEEERKLAATIVLSSTLFGVFLQFAISGYIIKAWGWHMVFYMNTLTGAIWTIIFIILGSKSAETSRFIREEEKAFIRNSLKQECDVKELKTPWYALWTSLSFLSLVIANSAHNWGLWTFMTLLPMYLDQTQGIDIVKNSLVSSAPFIAMFVMVLPLRYISNSIIKKKWFKVTTVRKIFSGLGFFGPGLGLLTIILFKTNFKLIAVILTFALMLNAGQYSGFLLGHEDMAPNFSNRMGRVTSGIADLLSVFAPLTAGTMLQGPDSWRYVFNLSASMYIVCGICYVVFGTSEKQQWNEPYRINSGMIQDHKETRRRY